jgi:pyridoxamine 5'-phosphate oxidase
MSAPSPTAAEIAALRREYMQRALNESDLASDPFQQFSTWFAEALACPAIAEANAMTVATVSADGKPHARYVLLKGFDAEGFVFFTNHDSDKGADLAVHPYAALTFGWLAHERQVRIEGPVTRTSREAVEAYFATRPRGSRLGAWASNQSRVIPNRAALEEKLAEAEARFPGDVPVPDSWGGYRVAPEQVEFWQGRQNRLHDRLRYRRDGARWLIERLAP